MNTDALSIEQFNSLLPALIIEEKKNKLLSQDEMRQMFSPVISRVTIHRWMKSGVLPYYQIGTKKYFKYEDVLDACRVSSKTKKNLEHQSVPA